jgi:hypothetical protein
MHSFSLQFLFQKIFASVQNQWLHPGTYVGLHVKWMLKSSSLNENFSGQTVRKRVQLYVSWRCMQQFSSSFMRTGRKGSSENSVSSPQGSERSTKETRGWAVNWIIRARSICVNTLEKSRRVLSFVLPGVVKQLGSNRDATQDSYQDTNKIGTGGEQLYVAAYWLKNFTSSSYSCCLLFLLSALLSPSSLL